MIFSLKKTWQICVLIFRFCFTTIINLLTPSVTFFSSLYICPMAESVTITMTECRHIVWQIIYFSRKIHTWLSRVTVEREMSNQFQNGWLCVFLCRCRRADKKIELNYNFFFTFLTRHTIFTLIMLLVNWNVGGGDEGRQSVMCL